MRKFSFLGEFLGAIAVAVALTSGLQADAASIIKIPLGETQPDVEFTGTTFRTRDDGIGGTTGLQNTSVQYVDFFDGLFADIPTSIASFTLDGITANGAATLTLGSIVTQATNGGMFSLYDPANTLLLQATLGSGAILGSAGASTGSFFNTAQATFTAGTLLPYLSVNSAGLSIALADIVSSTGVGLSISGITNQLNSFQADATGIIEGTAIPEPASLLLIGSGLVGIGAWARKRKEA